MFRVSTVSLCLDEALGSLYTGFMFRIMTACSFCDDPWDFWLEGICSGFRLCCRAIMNSCGPGLILGVQVL